MIDATSGRPLGLAAAALCLALAGCGSSGSSTGEPSAFQKFGNVVMFQSTRPPTPSQTPAGTGQPGQASLPPEEDTLVCPEVIISDGGAALRAQSGPDSGSLRHQISITNVARECTATGGGGFRLKVGAEGRILIGPAGSPGSYGATLTTQVLRGTTVVARRASRIGGTIAAGQGGTDFLHVEEGIVVPPGRGDVEIIVGLNSGGATPARARRR